jgi:ABC-type multidrug transport system ATPase subunit
MRLTGLRLEQVSRRFGHHVALRNVSLQLHAGQITLLLGPNGAGKTTLLKAASTLLPPTRGRVVAQVEVNGQALELDLGALAQERRDFVGLVSHASLLYEDLTGLENVALFARLYDVPSPDQRARALLEELGLWEAAGRRVAGYSRGMRQRLSIARALLQEPALVLLDEPFTGLDQDGIRIVLGVLRGLRARGALVLLITHLLTLPEDLVDRAVLIRGGQVAADGAPGEGGAAAWYERAMAEAR